MTQSLAAVVTGFKEPLELRNIDHPDLEPGAMLGRVEAATLCGTDLHIWSGGGRAQEGLPYIPGHETALIIEEMNGPREDVLGTQLRPGDRVISAYPFCGTCYYCSVANQPTLCERSLRYGRERCDQFPNLPRRVRSVPLRAPGERRRPHPRRGQRAAGSLRRMRPAHGHARFRAARGDREPRDRRGPGMRSRGPLRDRRGASAGRRKGHHHRRAREPLGGRAGVGRGRYAQSRRRAGTGRTGGPGCLTGHPDADRTSCFSARPATPSPRGSSSCAPEAGTSPLAEAACRSRSTRATCPEASIS